MEPYSVGYSPKTGIVCYSGKLKTPALSLHLKFLLLLFLIKRLCEYVHMCAGTCE